jgi:hypothetical protein
MNGTLFNGRVVEYLTICNFAGGCSVRRRTHSEWLAAYTHNSHGHLSWDKFPYLQRYTATFDGPHTTMDKKNMEKKCLVLRTFAVRKNKKTSKATTK